MSSPPLSVIPRCVINTVNLSLMNAVGISKLMNRTFPLIIFQRRNFLPVATQRARKRRSQVLPILLQLAKTVFVALCIRFSTTSAGLEMLLSLTSVVPLEMAGRPRSFGTGLRLKVVDFNTLEFVAILLIKQLIEI